MLEEFADVSKMYIDEMTVIFKSLDLVSASERVAESVSVRFGDSSVDIGYERGIVADYATKQRVLSAGEQPSVVTRVAAAQEGPDEAMRQALAASSATEASAAGNVKRVPVASSTMAVSAASDADMVEKNQIGGEKPVLIGSPMCCITMIKSQNVVEKHARCPGGQGVITTIMRDPNRVSEVKYKNFSIA